MSEVKYSHNPIFGLKHDQLIKDKIYDVLRPGYDQYTMGIYKGIKNGKLQFYNNRPLKHTTYEMAPHDSIRFKLKHNGDRWINIMKGGDNKEDNNNFNAEDKKIIERLIKTRYTTVANSYMKNHKVDFKELVYRLYKLYIEVMFDNKEKTCTIDQVDKDFIKKYGKYNIIINNIIEHILNPSNPSNHAEANSSHIYDPEVFSKYITRCEAKKGGTRKRLRKRGQTRR